MSDAELAEAQQAQQLAEASTSLDADTLAALAISETDVWHHTVDVADANSLQELATDYKSGARADLYMAKLADLRRLYERMHRVRGDGNCFYRALWVGWMQRLLSLPDARAREAVWRTRVPDVCAACRKGVPAWRRAEFDELGKHCVRATRALLEGGGGADGERRLLEAARDAEASARLLQWLRLVTSAHMRQRREQYAPHIEGRSLDDFCDSEVEAMGVEADEPQVQALASALGLRVRVEYLNAQSVPWSERCGPHRHVVCGAAADGGGARAKSRPLLAACLLFRPGHYDVLLPTDWNAAALDDDAADNPRFVAPLPAQLDAAAICPACAEQRLVACELCAAAVCARPGCARRGRATDDAAAGVGNDGDVQWLLPAAFARGGRAYACARCVAKCPRADDAADGAAAAAAAGTFALRRCPRGCGQLEFSERMYLHLAAGCAPPPEPPSPVRRIRPSRIRPPDGLPPAGLPGDGVSALIEMGFDIADARDALARAGGDVQGAAELLSSAAVPAAAEAAAPPPPIVVPQERDGQVEMLVREYKVTAAAAEAAIDAALHRRAFLEPGQVAGIEEAVELLFQPSELRKWRPTNDFSCDVCRRGFSSRHRRDEHQELRRDYAGSCDDADRAHNFIIRYQAAHRIDFNGAREACYEQWRRQGREL